MDLIKVLAELRLEYSQMGEAILSLERLALDRSRHPGFSSEGLTGYKKRGRPLGSKNRCRNDFDVPVLAHR